MMAVKSLPMQTRAEQQGFTLAEMIIVVVILGVLAAASAVFIRGPVDAYFASARRAELSDIADTAMRRIGRDVRAALPNSVRVAGACNGAAACYLEYIPVVAGGRYRAELSSTGTGNPLDFGNNSDTSFDIIGPAISIPAAGTKWVAIYNLGITGADAYSGDAGAADVRRRYNGAGGAVSSISFVSATRFPFESPARRFQVVTSPVTYACAPAVAGGQLLRYEGYAFSAGQPQPPGGAPAVLASNVTACSFSYTALQVAQRAGLVSMSLQLTSGGEPVNLFYQVHVSNVP
jgi:MSHA biogenesis protein MshO